MKKQEPARSRQKSNVTGSAHPASQISRQHGPAASEKQASDMARAVADNTRPMTVLLQRTESAPAHAGSAHPASQGSRFHGRISSESWASDRMRVVAGTAKKTTVLIKNTGSRPAGPNVPVVSTHTQDVASLREVAKQLSPTVRSTAGEKSKRHGRDTSSQWCKNSAPCKVNPTFNREGDGQ